jgi:hypothetical protein
MTNPNLPQQNICSVKSPFGIIYDVFLAHYVISEKIYHIGKQVSILLNISLHNIIIVPYIR